MPRLRLATLAGVLAVLVLAPLTLLAQQPPPDMPSREEIEEMIAEEFENLPETTTEIDGLTITYKEIPTDPADVLRGRDLPMDMTPEQVMQQYGHLARPYIEEWFGRIGTIEAERPVDYRGETIPAGEWTFGLAMQRQRPVGWFVHDEREEPERELDERIGDRFSRRGAPSVREMMTIELREADDEEGHHLLVGFNDVVCRTRQPLVVQD